MSAPSKFDLFRGEVLLGVVTLIADECDFPWQVGRLKPASGFRAVKPLFVKLARMLEAEDFSDEFDAVHEEMLRPGITLRSRSDGKVVEVIGIYVEGTRVSWR